MTAFSDEIERQRAFLRQIIDLDRNFIFAKDRQGRFVLVNQAVADAYGTTVEELTGKTDADFNANPNEIEHFRRDDLEVMDTGQDKLILEESITDATGRVRWLQTVKRPMTAPDGTTNMVLGVATDITERKQAEEALQDADRRKDVFLATLAHELRNPLAPIRHVVEVLHHKDLSDPDLTWARDVIDRQVQQLTHLIDDLLDVARLSRGQLVLRTEPTDIGAILHHAVETSQPLLNAAGHALTLRLPTEPLPLEAAPLRLAQVFTNLLNNAAKFTERGGQITVQAERQGTEAVVTVEDTGIGIPAAVLPTVFDGFTQADSSLERRYGGLGLGLSLVKALVERHGGRVEAHSAGPGHGSTFRVHLPLSLQPAAPASRPPRMERELAGHHRSHRILVVDDNVEAATSLAVLLELLGQDVQLAYEGSEALATAETFRPDVIFLDLGMPTMNGYEVARRLRAQPWGNTVRLVALTGWGQEEDRRRTQAAGFDQHWVKPLDPTALERFLAEMETVPGSDATRPEGR
jgi:PAS domain S-box-containing protein